jgi:hypothetical protein
MKERKPAGLAELHWLDRANAERFRKLVGTAAADRIARALANETRARGRPKADLSPYLAEAAFAWVTNPKWDEARAAREVARRLKLSGHAPDLSEEHLRRSLRTQLRGLPADLKAAAEEQARARRMPTRSDPPPPDHPTSAQWGAAIPPEVRSSFVVMVERLRVAAPGIADLVRGTPSAEALRDGVRAFHLAQALTPDLDDMDLRQIIELLRDVRRHVRRAPNAR